MRASTQRQKGFGSLIAAALASYVAGQSDDVIWHNR